MSTLSDLSVIGQVTQSEPAVDDGHLIRLGEAKALLSSLFKGDWNGGTAYNAGEAVTDGGSFYIAQAASTNLKPADNPGYWKAAATAGAASYVYIAYADDMAGNGFTLLFNSTKAWIAILKTTSPIATPHASDFAGLWVKYRGTDGGAGDKGDKGDDGDAGQSAYVYIGYASDANGTGYSSVFNANLSYIAFKATTTPIATPQASDFAGLWMKWKGEAGDAGSGGGKGDAGDAGQSAYVYVAYASSNAGANFSMAFDESLDWMAVKATTSPIATPQASDFVGLWARYKVSSVETETLTGTGTISLAVPVTYLSQHMFSPSAPVTMNLPDASARMSKRIFVPAGMIDITETFVVTGRFAGFGSLVFNAIGHSAILEWDGSAWQLVGGNATPTDEEIESGGMAGQVLTGNGTIDLSVPVTWLRAGVAEVNVQLPNGSYAGQTHSILIPSSCATNTASFLVAGTIVGGTKLRFTTLGTAAQVVWDGGAWQMMGGNAERV